MYRIYLLFFLLVRIQLISAQNLVSNPGFENFLLCPYDFAQIDFCNNWKSAGMPFWTSPDYFNTCSTNPNISPPIVSWGEQLPNSQNAYAFVSTFVTFPNPASGREYIMTELSQPLIINQTYYVSFYINLGGRSGVSIASNKIGALFSVSAFDSINFAHPINFSHVYADSIIADTITWFHFRKSFIADSAYNFVTIGNFFDDNNTDTTILDNTFFNASGYFIDDVCVSSDSVFCYNYNFIDEFSNAYTTIVYPNPVISKLYIHCDDFIQKISLFDISGRCIFKFEDLMNNEFVYDCTSLTSGIYLLNVNQSFKKIIINN